MKATFITATLAILASAVWWAAEVRLTAQDGLQATQIETGAEAIEPGQEGVEVLTRGPVHEAFAEPVTLQGTETVVIEKQPPQAVEELPPDQKPEGENVIWIPGYWAWDDERTDFLWISGVWRVAPPNQEWVPGYWSELEGGYAWTPGFWVSAELEEVAYLPEPPETLEEGATAPAPSEDHIWVPGVWRYQETRYVWRPGYWVEAQPDWVWTPAHYTWCPGGYVFVDGYWDYPLVRRGVLFAPVYFAQPIYTRPAYYYSPSIVINTNILTVHLFARPTYRHYYFGDYYGDRYADLGIRPWYYYHRERVGYDPIFTYYSWREGRRDRDWYRTLERRYDYFARNRDARPAHTYADYRRRSRDVNIRNTDIDINNTNITNVNNVNLAVTLNQLATREVNFTDNDRRQIRFERVDRDRRERIQENARELRQFTQQRRKVESEAPPARAAATDTADARQDRQRSRKALSLADRPRAQEISRRTDRNEAAETPPTNPEQAGKGRDTAGRNRGRARASREGDAAATDTADQGRTRGRQGRDATKAGETATTTDPSTDATGSDTASGTTARDRAGHDRARSRDAATTTPGASDSATPGPTKTGREGTADTTRTRDRAGRTARDAAGTTDRDPSAADPAGTGAADAARAARDRGRRAGGSEATTLPGDAGTRRGRTATESTANDALDALRDRRSGAADDRARGRASEATDLLRGRTEGDSNDAGARRSGASTGSQRTESLDALRDRRSGATGDRARGRTDDATDRLRGRTGSGGTDSGTPTRTRRSNDNPDSANAIEDRLNLQRGSLDSPTERTGRSTDRANVIENRLDLQRGSLSPDRGSSGTGGSALGGGQSVRANRQPLDPGAQRASPEDLRVQTPGDVRGEDDLGRRRLYGLDSENRVARPGRDDRAGARGTTEAGGERSADRSSGAAALPAIRQQRDAGAPNSDLDRSRTRPPSDVRREVSELNEDRRTFERNDRVSRPGRDSRGVGGSAPATDRPRNRLDLPDRGRDADRTPQSRIDRGAGPSRTTALRPTERSADRGAAERARAASRQQSANREAGRAAERVQAAARAERSTDRSADRARTAERSRGGERNRGAGQSENRRNSDEDRKGRKRDRD